MSRKPYQTLASRILVENPWFRLRQDDIRLPNGQQAVYNVINKPDAVVIVPILTDGRMVLINQYRYPIEKWCIEVPAGGIPDNTPPEVAARNELAEEIGGQAQSLLSLGAFWSMKGIGDEKMYIYLALGVTLGQTQREATEIIELRIVSIAEALHMARSNEIDDGPSALAILLSEAHLS